MSLENTQPNKSTETTPIPKTQQEQARKFSRGVSEAYQKLLERTRRELGEDGIEIISGPDVGRVLQLFATNSKNVLEIGTFSGLGTLSLAEAVPEGGRVTTIDHENGLAQQIGREAWQDAGVDRKITSVIDDALKFIPTIEDNSLDLVFIDGQNVQYQKYLDCVLPKIQKSGVVIIDDTLDGDLSNPSSERDKRTAEFNIKLRDDPRFLFVQALDVGEGLTVAIKK